MGFAGFSRDIQPFFRELKANNTKEWFDANRDRFDALVMKPAQELVIAMAEPLSKLDPPHAAVPKLNQSIRRIFRDTRFSADKTPYHTHLHLIFFTGAKANQGPGIHIVLGDDRFGYGGGHWAFGPGELEHFRASVAADNGAEIARIVDATCAYSDLELDPPALKTVAKGFDKDTAWADWTRYKGLVVRSHGIDVPDDLFGPGCVDYLTGLCRNLAPFNRFLCDRVFSGG